MTLDLKAAGIVAIICLFTFYFRYDIAYTVLLLGYTIEIMPYQIRASLASSCRYIVQWFTGSLVIAAFVNPIGLDNAGWRCFLALVSFVAYVAFPERRGHSLEKTAEVYDGPSAAAKQEVSNAENTSSGSSCMSRRYERCSALLCGT
ncbi:hypothetical protein EJ03DRAFT_52255 [Teratosphaeria nubilosa]|uniref:Major facilitator superfamily (MFS) profile domain-containing protein n=1 Tax=Teratosphaeria nubilosa TaxID=161662 RepID=A0A6G1LEE7_9PEZI|nr:hypothetical protein EJ03DRAFT_52255 [Teratosphaeria nubilosa]